MKTKTLDQIAELRRENYSYQFIADTIGMRMNTVKSICRREGFTPVGSRKTKWEKEHPAICRCCLKPLQNGLRSDTKYCSDYCRTKWRRANLKIAEKCP